MRNVAAVVLFIAAGMATVAAHDVSTNITWNREISRIVVARCASCHQQGGTAFSLLTYQEAKPWAAAIKDRVLRRQMPPWGAVKGFGAFRNEIALGQEEIDLIRNWVDGGAPEGNPDHLAIRPVIPAPPLSTAGAANLVMGENTRLDTPFTMDGFVVRNAPADDRQIVVQFPDGRLQPLVWLHDYHAQSPHPFLLRAPLSLPAGTRLRGLSGASLALIPAK